jgi:protein-tyrosine-phosphatase
MEAPRGAPSAEDRPWTILFLSQRGAARSVMAAAIAEVVSGSRLRGLAAAVRPDPQRDDLALQILRNHGHPLEAVPAPRHYADVTAGPDPVPLDFVFTLSDTAAGEVLPVWPGQPVTAHWSCPDPVRAAAAAANPAERALAYAAAYAVLDRRLRILAALPLGQLDRMRLQAAVTAIGRQR